MKNILGIYRLPPQRKVVTHIVICKQYRNALRAPRKIILLTDSCLAPVYSGHSASASCLIYKASYHQIFPSWQLNNGASTIQVVHPVSQYCSSVTKDLHWLLRTYFKFHTVKRVSSEFVMSVVYD